MPEPLTYPYVLDQQTESVFLAELASVLDVLLYRADEIEQCIAEIRERGAAHIPIAEAARWNRGASGSIRLFAAIEALLAAYARVSLLLYPIRKADAGRGMHLRTILRIDSSSRLADRRLRDGWMHLDEDIGKLSVSQDGGVSASVIAVDGEKWYHHAQRGSVRIVDPESVSVALPRRGVWMLRPYFQLSKDLRAQVAYTSTNPYRWLCFEGICGIALGWSGRPERWIIKSLGGGFDIAVESSTYLGAVSAFETAAQEWRAKQA
jgi:hypothetical protein